MVFKLGKAVVFPDTALADEDGLLAIGGDLSAERLLAAYALGIFPWYSTGEPILWHSPHRRFVLPAAEVKVSHSMKSLIKQGKYTVTYNTCFKQVITHCAKVPRPGQRGTWLNKHMIEAYTLLHQMGKAHSVEVWHNGQLAGGLYGVAVGPVFCGESMFSLQPNASKLALITLCQSGTYRLIDCQTYTPHLESMGARFIARTEFEKWLRQPA